MVVIVLGVVAVPFVIAALKGRLVVGLVGLAFVVATFITGFGGDISGVGRFAFCCAALYWAIALAKPGSYWARNFYNDEKMSRAVEKEKVAS